MLTRYRHLTLAVLLVMVAVPSCLAQQTASRRASTASSTLSDAKNVLALKALDRLRAIRDCWIDPYAMLPYDEPKQKGEGDFYGCGSEYALRLAEAQAAVKDALDSVDNPAIIREADAAIAVFVDLDTLRHVFNRTVLSSLLETTSVSDVYPIIHTYNLKYAENTTAKGEIYRQMMPLRRVHIDRLAALIPNAPADSNPTLTPEQAIAGNDDLTWNRAKRDMAYEWYLRAYPNGRHATEARQSISRKDEIQKEREDQLEAVRRDLEQTTRNVLQAYVRGDKVTYGNFLSARFPAREIYIAKLKPQPDVASFDITQFEAKPYDPDQQSHATTMNLRYMSIFNKTRDYQNRILYQKTDHGWQIVEWH